MLSLRQFARLRRIPLHHARSVVSQSVSDKSTADNALGALGLDDSIAPTVKAEEPVEDWMLLQPLDTNGRGRRREPLLNIPPPEDPLLHLLASMIMTHGERAKANRIVSNTLLHIYTLTRAPPLPILRQAVLYASPAVKTMTRTHGAKIVHTPIALSEKQRTHYGISMLLEAAKKRTGRRLEERLAREMVDILQKVHTSIEANQRSGNVSWGGALDKKMEQHRFAMVNRGGVRIAPGAMNAAAIAQAA
ncbi:Ribosomal protein [Mycena indigotica]|uniref:Ribosomal protein n=1 Tax=Mycena indigotica TaxID=2126181 RepID=A0A8H6SMS1_9AGAR|nr:Ribosomal protein [Mycena indigotica]KAF7301092.1 Ribosomal protein [Mycena indigotica]